MVIDTMVFAYALLRVEDKHEQALAALEGAGQIIVPDSLFSELGNVVWQWIQFRQLPLQVGLACIIHEKHREKQFMHNLGHERKLGACVKYKGSPKRLK